MRWALICHPAQVTKEGPMPVAAMVIAEDCLPTAMAQGWKLLGRDTGVYDDRILQAFAPVDVPLHSNPRRCADPPPSNGDEA